MANEELLSALDFSELGSIDEAEQRLDSAFEGGLIDLFTYQDIKGKAQQARQALASVKDNQTISRGGGGGFLGGIFAIAAASVFAGPVGFLAGLGGVGGYFLSQRGTADSRRSKIRSEFLTAIEDMAVGSATQSSSIYAARARATTQLRLSQLGSKQVKF